MSEQEQKTAANMSFSEYAKAHGGLDEGGEEEATSVAPPVAAEPAKEKALPAAPTGTPRDLLARARHAKTPEEAADLTKQAFVSAFGEGPEAFNINSRQWTAYSHQKKRDRDALAAKEGQLRDIANQLDATYGPLARAKELWDKGDVEGATKLAFGIPAHEYNKKLHRQVQQKDPHIEAMEARLAEYEEREAAREQEALAAYQRSKQEAAMEEDLDNLAEHLADSGDPVLKRASQLPRFVALCYEKALALDADELTEDDLSIVFADAKAEYFGSSEEDGELGAQTQRPTPAAEPVRQVAKKIAAKPLKQSEAAEVAVSPPEKDSPERDARIKQKFARMLLNTSMMD